MAWTARSCSMVNSSFMSSSTSVPAQSLTTTIASDPTRVNSMVPTAALSGLHPASVQYWNKSVSLPIPDTHPRRIYSASGLGVSVRIVKMFEFAKKNSALDALHTPREQPSNGTANHNTVPTRQLWKQCAVKLG